MPKIVTIGGGTGAPTIIQALLKAGFTDLSCICASTDSGGKTGFIRSDERDQVIAISDLLRNLIALISTTNHQKNITAFTDLISYIDGRNRNIGYLIYYALLEKYQNNFLKVQKHLENLLGIKFGGTAIPITTEPSTLCFSTTAGQVYKGEHELDKQSMSKNMIIDLWMEPAVRATPIAIESIKTADYIIYTPGSLYGSILANFLPLGAKEALKETKAKKILITNLVSNRNQTHKFTVQKYIKVFRKYTGLKKPIDVIITPDISEKQFDRKYHNVATTYFLEHAHFIGWSRNRTSQKNKNHPDIVRADIMSITPNLGRLRHSPKKLAKVLRNIIT